MKDRGKLIWDKCGFSEGWEFPRTGLSGGLLLALMPKQCLIIRYESKHLVHIDLLENRGNPLSITFVYGNAVQSHRIDVWNKLRSFKSISHPNWLCIGDFNQILSLEDKFAFHLNPITGAESFQQMIDDLALCELVSSGQKFTWMNRREEDGFVMEKLDRAFASIEWVNSYPKYVLRNLPIVRPDHGPILLDCESSTPFRRRPFRFEKMWLSHSSCKSVVQKSWA